jgi:hypothetical protein
MSADEPVWDLTEVEERWARRRARLAEFHKRVDRTGMTRPRNEQGSTPRPSRHNAI